MTTKVSVSLPDDDVSFLDEYNVEHQLGGRSGAVHEAIAALRDRNLAQEYADAYAEFTDSGEAKTWDATAGDGIDA
jgi:Arc/MetJ-type ribon-helix-helix transcriptional regulator